jgi:galactokinase/mevalonate kinase-like predicted kinase
MFYTGKTRSAGKIPLQRAKANTSSGGDKFAALVKMRAMADPDYAIFSRWAMSGKWATFSHRGWLLKRQLTLLGEFPLPSMGCEAGLAAGAEGEVLRLVAGGILLFLLCTRGGQRVAAEGDGRAPGDPARCPGRVQGTH